MNQFKLCSKLANVLQLETSKSSAVCSLSIILIARLR